MKGAMRSLGVAIVILAGLVQLSTQTVYLNGTEQDICRLFKDKVKLRKPGTCDEWIVCENYVSTEGGICPSGAIFSLSSKACSTKQDTSDTYCFPCTASTEGYIGTNTNCGYWYYCDKKTLKGSGSCPTGMLFDKTSKTCVYPKDTTCVPQYEFCDLIPEKTPFLDEENCHKYYTCKSFKLVVNNCTTGMYYDVASGACVDSKLVTCVKHPIPEEICGTKKLAVRNKFVADNVTCRGYYYCKDLGSGVPDTNPTWLQCPTDRFFNQERQGCFPRETQKCSGNRCDGRESGLEVAETDGCQHYIKCVDGKESSTTPLSCDNGMYFNVYTESCTSEVTSYGACTST